jgi:hypothetical protein
MTARSRRPPRAAAHRADDGGSRVLATPLQASGTDTPEYEASARRRWLVWALLAGWLSPPYVASRVDVDILGGRP